MDIMYMYTVQYMVKGYRVGNNVHVHVYMIQGYRDGINVHVYSTWYRDTGAEGGGYQMQRTLT
jgi:hypothetical protein